MRRFELVDGSSSKFWEVEMAECDVTVRYGRIGTHGQTKTKSFASAEAARQQHDAWVKEKTGKGYGEAGTAGGARLAAVAGPVEAIVLATPERTPECTPERTPEPAPEPAPGPTPAAPVAVLAVTPSAPATIDWPEGGFQWTDELRRRLPVVRGIPARPQIDGKALSAESIAFDDDAYGHHASTLKDLAHAAGRSWVYWGAERSAALIQQDHLARADHEFWLELCAQAAASPVKLIAWTRSGESGRIPDGLQWVTDVGIGLHGVTFMVPVALDLARAAENGRVQSRVANAQLRPLRRAIAASDQAAHDTVIAVLDEQPVALHRIADCEPICAHIAVTGRLPASPTATTRPTCSGSA